MGLIIFVEIVALELGKLFITRHPAGSPSQQQLKACRDDNVKTVPHSNSMPPLAIHHFDRLILIEYTLPCRRRRARRKN